MNGVLEKIDIFDETEPEKFSKQRGIVLRAIDKLDRLGIGGVKELLGKGRKDSSGDYTDGANLSNNQIDLIIMFLEANSVIKTFHVGGDELPYGAWKKSPICNDFLSLNQLKSNVWYFCNIDAIRIHPRGRQNVSCFHERSKAWSGIFLL